MSRESLTTTQLDEIVDRLVAEDQALRERDKRFSDFVYYPEERGYLRDLIRRVLEGV